MSRSMRSRRSSRPSSCPRLARRFVRVRVSDDVEHYLVALVRATREHRDVRLGASPRSSVALYRCAQAWAALDSRHFVLPDDVRHLLRPVLAHRLVLDLDRELRGATREQVLSEILEHTPVPMAEPE